MKFLNSAYCVLRGQNSGRRLAYYALFLLTIILLPNTASYAQQQPTISAPLPGTQLRGTVPIIGTSDVANFSRYEISFGYDPNPTNTWFLLTSESTARVNSELFLWDTTSINDGNYMVRLRVFDTANNSTEYLLTNVSVGNDAPLVLATPVPTATATPLPVTPTPTATTITIAQVAPTATPLQLAIDDLPEATAPSAVSVALQPFTEALLRGILLTSSIALVFGFYLNLRRRYRYRALAWWRELKARSRR